MRMSYRKMGRGWLPCPHSGEGESTAFSAVTGCQCQPSEWSRSNNKKMILESHVVWLFGMGAKERELGGSGGRKV